jgi:hypothetical protein
MDPFLLGGIFAVLIVAGVVAWVSIEHRKIKWYIALSSGLLATVITLLYAEFGPGGGNLWFRNVGEQGEKQFIWTGVFKVLFEPLIPKAILLWSPEWWLSNVFVLFPLILIPMTYIIRK